MAKLQVCTASLGVHAAPSCRSRLDAQKSFSAACARYFFLTRALPRPRIMMLWYRDTIVLALSEVFLPEEPAQHQLCPSGRFLQLKAELVSCLPRKKLAHIRMHFQAREIGPCSGPRYLPYHLPKSEYLGTSEELSEVSRSHKSKIFRSLEFDLNRNSILCCARVIHPVIYHTRVVLRPAAKTFRRIKDECAELFEVRKKLPRYLPAFVYNPPLASTWTKTSRRSLRRVTNDVKAARYPRNIALA